MPRKSRRKDLSKIDPKDVVGNPREMLRFFRLSRNTKGKTKIPLTQDQVSELMQCRKTLVGKIENGGEIPARNFRRYWVALGFRFDQLIETEDAWTISNELFWKIVNKRGLVAEPAIRNLGKRLLPAHA